MASVYRISKDPKGLLKKPPSYFFHGYDRKYGSAAVSENFEQNKEKTKDLDNLIDITPEETVKEFPEDNDDDVVFGVTSTPPAEVVRPERDEPDEGVDEMLAKTFGMKDNSSGRRKKRRDGKIRTTVQVDEDIKAMRQMEQAEADEDEDSDVKVMPEETDHGPLYSESDNPYDDDHDYDSDDNDEEEFEIEEYTDPENGEYFVQHFRSAVKNSVFVMLGGIIAFIALLYLESFSFAPFIPRPAFIDPAKMRLVLVLVDIQLLVISGVLIYENFIKGIKSLFTGKPNCDSVTVCVMLVCLIHSLAMCVISTPDNLILYSSVGAFFGMISSLKSIFESRRNLCTFKLLTLNDEKIVAEKVEAKANAFEELGEYFSDEEPTVFELKKADFVDGAVKNIETRPASDRNFKIIIPLVFIVSVLFAALMYIREKNICYAVNSFAAICLAALPASSLVYISLPYLIESLRSSTKGCVMIGGNTFEECSLASAVVLNDIAVFPSSGIKVNSVRTYGEHRIDHMIMYAARIFKTVGGPLASVFESCIKSAVDEISPIEIVSVESDGIHAYIDGNDIYIGKKSFMMAYNFGFVKDSTDDSFENSVGRIMYMTVGDNIAAKFYIKYSITRGFEKILANLSKADISVGIKTCDPNIDDALLKKLLRKRTRFVSIINSDDPLPSNEKKSGVSAGLVCNKNAFDLLKGFLSCDKVAKNVSLNIFTKFVSIIVAFTIVAVLALMNGNNISGITPQFLIVYQALWMMPAVATAIFG